MLVTSAVSSLLKPSSTKIDLMANRKGMHLSSMDYNLLLFVHYHCSIGLVELANETAAEQACTKLSET